METYIKTFKTVSPRHAVSQDDLLSWLCECHLKSATIDETMNQEDLEKLKKRIHHYAVSSSLIHQRLIDLDFNELTGHDIGSGSQLFDQKVLDALGKMYGVNKQRPDHLIHVTCTGYISPSPVQKMISDPSWNYHTEITHAYHMGCYASMPALRLATSLAKEKPSGQVDIVHTEMCSLHLNAKAHSPEQLIVQSLFADGYICYEVSTQKNVEDPNFKILAIKEKLIAHSSQDMGWVPAPFGMQMTLGRDVPKKLSAPLKEIFIEMIKEQKLSALDLKKAVFAIHPGGPKIIDAVKEALELDEEQIKESRKVLYERGNMSSATLPHVWNEILKNNYPRGTHVISFAFGPGLTLFISLFEVC